MFFLLSVNGDLDSSLAVRDFDSAMEIAGDSDSLKAVVFRSSGNYTMAAIHFQRAFEKEPSAGLFCDIWNSVAGSTEHYGSLSAAGLREDLVLWGNEFSWTSSDLLSLIESSSTLDDSLLTDSLVLVLTDGFQGSLEASSVIGWRFYDDLYPVWNNDSARVVVLEEFIEEWGEYSELWRSRAWQYTLAAVVETSDSLQWKDYFVQWQEACPEDPLVYLTGAALCIDRDSSWTEALLLAGTGLELMQAGWVPLEMPEEEWRLTGEALEAGLQFRLLFAMTGLGRHQEAFAELSEVISTTNYDVNDYHTEASLLWLEGKLFLACSDTLNALGSFAESAIAGGVRDRWSGYAVTAMDSLLPYDVTPLQWAREYTCYSGPCFSDVTGMLGPDSLLKGTRMSWCDWNSDGFPDLFTGRLLFQNAEGSGFADVTSLSGLDSCRGNGGIWGDINGDGVPDLVTSGNPVQLFVNHRGVLEDVTEAIGLIATDASVEGVALLDWNADGWLDLYLASYESGQGSGTADAFYLGSEDGFVPAGADLGMIPFLEEHLCGRGVSPCDFDLDGDVDIFVSNYRLQENFLWENDRGIAVNSSLERGVAGVETDGWWGHTIGSAWGDHDNDGDWDLFSANLAHPRYIEFSDRSMLLQNNDNCFTDIRANSGISFEETHSNPVWGDFNNDGLLDLFITSIYPDRRSFLYMNCGNGQFEDVTWLSGARVFNGWGAAAGDFDLDGLLDLAIGSGDGPTLLRNTASSEDGSWLLVHVVPPEGVNSSALGCIVKLEQNGVVYMRQIEGGSGTTSQNSGLLHFGLPCNDTCLIKLYIPGEEEPISEVYGFPAGEVFDIGRE
ncbi:MAG: VCBS repeat-containing protein [Candidatus Sabulitectum sp.]|nr:VCBS repeat-containing protein [Candidatus Sabulitectum sp.]